jgi:hypothetical protein
MPCRVGDAIGPGGVVGEEKQAFAGLIKPADRGEVGFGGPFESGENGVAAFLVGGAGDQTLGLVQHDENRYGGGYQFAIHQDDLPFELHRELRIAPHDAVHLDTSSACQRGTSAA